MSVALVPEPEDCDTAPLVVAFAASANDGQSRAVDIQNHRQLVAQLLASRNVALVPKHGPQVFVHPRHAEESAANWLAPGPKSASGASSGVTSSTWVVASCRRSSAPLSRASS